MNRAERLVQDGYDGIEPVLFYRPGDDYGCFSNFSWHSVVLINPWTDRPCVYKTGEHRFQAMKATSDVDHDYVASAPTPFEAKERGGPRGIALRDDWGNDYDDVCYRVMLEIVTAKTFQHEAVRQALRASGTRPIYEDAPVDAIWGWRSRNDHRGKNLLGRCWMEVRDAVLVSPGKQAQP